MAEIHHHPVAPLPLEPFLARYRDGRRRANIAPLYQAMLEEAERLAAPATVHAEYAVDEVPELTPWLPPESATVVLAVCTLGPSVETRVNELFPDEPPSAIVLDELAVAMVSGLARELHASIRRAAAARGLKAGPPYRPGVGRWPLETQRVLFARLPAGEIGVELTDYLMMTPTRSISLIIPLIHSDKRGAIQ